ncbi:MAG: T9SS type A sorting domain-containing protein [Muribaculaceae bacterium]|nr:T9SS type A sorting domain-containing protein [Muribaculaceae bacterium]
MPRITKYTRLLLATVVLIAAVAHSPALSASAKAPVWEIVTTTDSVAEALSQDMTQNRLEIVVRDGFVYITVDAPVKVEVFTILGQLVTSKTLQPGTVRLTLSQRGIYILKGAGATKRINF